jgi:inhibitor of KinA sporulation pathway (predicted exonuclease)
MGLENLEHPFMALDLELNNARDGSTPNPKIIQVGVAFGTWEQYKDNAIVTKKWYIDPQEPIYPFITTLTGITDEDVANGLPHSVIAQELGDMIEKHKPFVNPVTWGGGDSVELLSEFKQRGIAFPHFGRRWIDVKTWYVMHMLSTGKTPAGGLKSAMAQFKIPFKGVAHRADVDAHNTLRFCFALLERQSNINKIIKASKEIL